MNALSMTAAALAAAVVLPLAGLFALGAGAGGIAGAAAGLLSCTGPAPGTVLPSGAVLSSTQARVAGEILETASKSATSTQPMALALIDAGWTESRLDATAVGGTRSLGVFQERASQGWGTPEEEENPITATLMWLERIPGGWETLSAPALAQAVERSKYPTRYQENLADARAIVAGSCGGGVLSGTATSGARTTPPTDWTPPQATDAAEAVAASFALDQLGKPYVWDSGEPHPVAWGHWTCSSLTASSWYAAGVTIGSTTYTQVLDGTPVRAIATLRAGDLVFIMGSDPLGGLPGHVGIYVGYGELVDAPYAGQVVQEIPISDWAGQIVAMRRIA